MQKLKLFAGDENLQCARQHDTSHTASVCGAFKNKAHSSTRPSPCLVNSSHLRLRNFTKCFSCSMFNAKSQPKVRAQLDEASDYETLSMWTGSGRKPFIDSLTTDLSFWIRTSTPLSYRLIEGVFGNSGQPLPLFTPSLPDPRLAFFFFFFWPQWETLFHFFFFFFLRRSHSRQTFLCPEETRRSYLYKWQSGPGLNGALFTATQQKEGPQLDVSSAIGAFLPPDNAQLFPWKFQVPRKGELCIITLLPNSDLCFPSSAYKGLITYCQLWGEPQSSTVARQIGSCWLMAWLAVRFA